MAGTNKTPKTAKTAKAAKQLYTPHREQMFSENDAWHDYDYDQTWFDVTEQMDIERYVFRPLSRYMNNDPHEDLA